jgi:hypothetical protein
MESFSFNLFIRFKIYLFHLTFFKGHLRLVNAIGKTYTKFMGREIDPINEILITVGAYGSLFNAFTSLLEKGDEVIRKFRLYRPNGRFKFVQIFYKKILIFLLNFMFILGNNY